MTMIHASILATSTLLLGACAAEPVQEPAPRIESSIDDVIAPSCPLLPTHSGIESLDCDPGPDDVALDPELCAELDAEALALVASHMTCEIDMQCDAVRTTELLGDTCAPALSCYLPVSTQMAEPIFVEEALALDARYAEACGCPIPSCVSPDYTLSLCEGSCTLETDVPPTLELAS